MEHVARLASQRAVVIFSTSSCCMCHTVTQLFRELGVNTMVVELDKDPRGNEMEKALVSLSAQLHRGLSKLAEMEADRAAGRGRSIGCDTDVASFSLRSEQWGDRLAASEYLPSFSHALSLGEMDDVELMGGQRRKAQKVKPIVPLIGDILFSRRKSTKEKGDDGSYSGDLYGVLG